MKIIICYASAGSGHRRAAEAVYQFLKKCPPQVNTTLLDILEYTNPFFADSYSRGYSFLVTRLKLIWAFTYYLTSIKYFALVFNFICRLNCRRFINLLLREQPDIVLATHFLPAEITSYLKAKGRINSRLVTVLTDFGLHTLWVFRNCDNYLVGSDYTRGCLIARGINQDKIRVTGVPVDSRFSLSLPDSGAGSKQEGAGFRALVVTGAFGFPLIEKIVDQLFSQVRLLVVCGRNRRLYNRLKRKQYQGLELFGLTDKMPRLMSQANIIITKPGGLTIAEALAAQLPMIFIGGIPGQETENARILESCGCAINAKSPGSLRNIIIELKNNPQESERMRANIGKFRRPNAAEEICQYVCSGSV